MAGYSGTPLVKKLGYKEGFRVYVKNPPEAYPDWLAPLPQKVQFLKRCGTDLDLIHLFTKQHREFTELLPLFRRSIKASGMIWISWPKVASKVPTDMREGCIRDIALPLGLVDTKVCAVDDVWSGLKLVIRKELR